MGYIVWIVIKKTKMSGLSVYSGAKLKSSCSRFKVFS